MLEVINDMPAGTIGFAVKGAVTAAECERTLFPLMAGSPTSGKQTGILLLFGSDFDDFRAEALAGDAQFAFSQRPDFGRLAIVSDVAWLRKAVKLFALLVRGEMRLFHDYELEQAKTWIASTPRGPTLVFASRSRSR